jgi:peptidoglycan hydrolase-like protein with peptidoglycan-binding domain
LATAAGAPVPKKAAPPPAKKSAPAAKKRPAPGKPSAAASKKRPSPSRKSPSKSKSKKRLPSWRTSQQAPTRERYLEIQQALVARGFLAGPPSGVWGAESVAALKKFQASQNLEPSGKLDSLSLIALGLGPKRETNGAKPPPVSEPKQP